MNFINQLNSPRNIDLRTAFMSPFQGISFLLYHPALLFKVLMCSFGIMLSLPLFIIGFVTIPIFLCMIMLMVINEITGDNLSFTEIMSQVYVNIKVKIKSFIILSFLPLLACLYIIYSLTNNGNSPLIIYEFFALLCFLIIWGIVIIHCLLICNQKNQMALYAVFDSLNLLAQKPFLLFGQLIAWIMGLMFVMAVLFSYVLILPAIGIQHGTMLSTLLILMIIFLAVAVYLSFYVSGVTVLMYHRYSKETSYDEYE